MCLLMVSQDAEYMCLLMVSQDSEYMCLVTISQDSEYVCLVMVSQGSEYKLLTHGQPGFCHLHWPESCCRLWLFLIQLDQSTSACIRPSPLCCLHAATS